MDKLEPCPPTEYQIECWPPRQTGGQVAGGVQNGVRITHFASGLQAVCTDERSQHRNREIAMAMIEGGLTCPMYRGPMPTAAVGAVVGQFAAGHMTNGKPAVFTIEQLSGENGFIGRNTNPGTGVIAKPGFIPWKKVTVHPTIEAAMIAAAPPALCQRTLEAAAKVARERYTATGWHEYFQAASVCIANAILALGKDDR